MLIFSGRTLEIVLYNTRARWVFQTTTTLLLIVRPTVVAIYRVDP